MAVWCYLFWSSLWFWTTSARSERNENFFDPWDLKWSEYVEGLQFGAHLRTGHEEFHRHFWFDQGLASRDVDPSIFGARKRCSAAVCVEVPRLSPTGNGCYTLRDFGKHDISNWLSIYWAWKPMYMVSFSTISACLFTFGPHSKPWCLDRYRTCTWWRIQPVSLGHSAYLLLLTYGMYLSVLFDTMELLLSERLSIHMIHMTHDTWATHSFVICASLKVYSTQNGPPNPSDENSSFNVCITLIQALLDATRGSLRIKSAEVKAKQLEILLQRLQIGG